MAMESSPKLVYLSHPYGGDPKNLQRAKRWLRWAWLNHEDTAFIAPWIASCEVLGDQEGAYSGIGLNADEEITGMCDAIWLCGGQISAGMRRELKAAERYELEIVNLTDLGAEPPADGNSP